RNGSRYKQIFARHSKVALRIIRRYATLVSEGEPNPIPRQIMSLGRNSGVDRRRSVPARECDPKLAAFRDCFARLLENERGGVGNEIFTADDCWGSAHAGFHSNHAMRLAAFLQVMLVIFFSAPEC